MTEQQDAIWEYLITHALGHANAIHVEELASNLGMDPKGTNNDDLRRLITDMVVNHGKQVGTFQDGVFIILNDAEREMAAKFLERNTRADAVRRNGNYTP